MTTKLTLTLVQYLQLLTLTLLRYLRILTLTIRLHKIKTSHYQ